VAHFVPEIAVVFTRQNSMPLNTRNELQTRLLSRIALSLRVIVIAIIVAFCFIASSVCLTLLLAIFLAVLVDPAVSYLHRWHIPRSIAAALIILVFMIGAGFAVSASYNKSLELVDQLPQLTDHIRDAMRPLNDKIQRVQETAGSLTLDTAPPKRMTEVKIRQTPQWPSYIVRGVGSVWGAVVIAGVVPFLMFFMLIRKEHMNVRLQGWLGQRIDVPLFVDRVGKMVRGFVLGNFVIGITMSAITVGVLALLRVHGAVALGIVSGILNLIPFLGVVLATIVPGIAALMQFSSFAPLLIIVATVITLHLISANILIPKLVGSRVEIGPVSATVGLLFWGWLWGVLGLLLAVPLTAFVKIVADSHPSLIHISNLLAVSPRRAPRSWFSNRKKTVPEKEPAVAAAATSTP
jgi:predicted PurR-regulated permease PerM